MGKYVAEPRPLRHPECDSFRKKKKKREEKREMLDNLTLVSRANWFREIQDSYL